MVCEFLLSKAHHRHAANINSSPWVIINHIGFVNLVSFFSVSLIYVIIIISSVSLDLIYSSLSNFLR